MPCPFFTARTHRLFKNKTKFTCPIIAINAHSRNILSGTLTRYWKTMLKVKCEEHLFEKMLGVFKKTWYQRCSKITIFRKLFHFGASNLKFICNSRGRVWVIIKLEFTSWKNADTKKTVRLLSSLLQPLDRSGLYKCLEWWKCGKVYNSNRKRTRTNSSWYLPCCPPVYWNVPILPKILHGFTIPAKW